MYSLIHYSLYIALAFSSTMFGAVTAFGAIHSFMYNIPFSWNWLYIATAVFTLFFGLIFGVLISIEYINLRKNNLHFIIGEYDSAVEMLDDLRDRGLVQFFFKEG